MLWMVEMNAVHVVVRLGVPVQIGQRLSGVQRQAQIIGPQPPVQYAQPTCTIKVGLMTYCSNSPQTCRHELSYNRNWACLTNQ